MLLGVYAEATGKKAEPLSIGGGTYARAFENAVAFGIEPEGEPAQCHMPDESRTVESIRFDTRMMAEAIRRLAGA
jgi:succinyl-diaminopimelate desuccinylase